MWESASITLYPLYIFVTSQRGCLDGSQHGGRGLTSGMCSDSAPDSRTVSAAPRSLVTEVPVISNIDGTICQSRL